MFLIFLILENFNQKSCFQMLEKLETLFKINVNQTLNIKENVIMLHYLYTPTPKVLYLLKAIFLFHLQKIALCIH